ncbi:hypothetical protein RRG08_030280 [Elysia crispata]|uniref:Uncharacterized protein n=1 Tax=Elysia crispata TaxID=231223 RepID=A0AAE1AKY9_9GAST|nr:hypothetical protein RRG08_030280 [Elysia crispata]
MKDHFLMCGRGKKISIYLLLPLLNNRVLVHCTSKRCVFGCKGILIIFGIFQAYETQKRQESIVSKEEDNNLFCLRAKFCK